MDLSIIGTAGRHEDYDCLNAELYQKMVKDAAAYIHSHLSDWTARFGTGLHLVSGGAAWADHIAVSLYLMGAGDSLTLYIPGEWDDSTSRFTGNRDAGIANWYHSKFSTNLANNQDATLQGIQKAKNKGARVIPYMEGFKARNVRVGKSNVILAYTFGESPARPKDGGTMHCWSAASAEIKIHRRIHLL